MSYRQAFGSVAFGLAVAAAALWAMRPPEAPQPVFTPVPAPLHYYVASMNNEDYRVQAHEFRIDGFCTVFLRDGRPFAAICGQHTVSEAVEVE